MLPQSSSASQPPRRVGVGIDTSRYGHHACLLRHDLQPAGPEFAFAESAEGYQQLRSVLERVLGEGEGAGPVHFCIRLDAAGQYADNLLHYVHGLAQQRADRGRTFSVNLQENVFQCFDAQCAKKGDVIDLWASVKGMSLRDAALDLINTFGLEPVPPTEKRHG